MYYIFRIPAAAVRACCKLLGITLKVEGLENIIRGTGSVVLINHQSMLDLIGKCNLYFFIYFVILTMIQVV